MQGPKAFAVLWIAVLLAASPVFGDGAECPPACWAIVDLPDHTRVEGQSSLTALTVVTTAGEVVTVSLERAVTVRPNADKETATLTLAGGKQLVGAVRLGQFVVETAAGPKAFALAGVSRLRLLPPVTAAWTGRRGIVVSNPGEALTDYAVCLDVPRSRGMRADYADLRFVTASAQQVLAWKIGRDTPVLAFKTAPVLSHWVESRTDQKAKAWVRFPVLKKGNNYAFVLHGNPTATPVSSGDDTFLVFDDFAGPFDAGKWQRNRDASKGGCGGFVKDGVLHVYGGDNNARGWVRARRLLPNRLAVESRAKLWRANSYVKSGMAIVPPHFGLDAEITCVEYNYYTYRGDARSRRVADKCDSFYLLPYGPGPRLCPYWQDTWFRQRLTYDGTSAGNNVTYTRDKGDREESIAHTAPQWDGKVGFRIQPWAWYQAPNHRIYVDWIAIRPHATPEPEVRLVQKVDANLL